MGSAHEEPFESYWEFEAELEELWDGGEGEDERSSEYLRWLQRALNQVLGAQLAVDGVIGPKTRSAVRSFQERSGLSVDGIVGPLTEQALVAAGAPAPPSGAHAAGATSSGSAGWLATVVPLLESARGDIPMDFLLGWIDVESGGDIHSHTSLDERGYFQLLPEESQTLHIDHPRLSTDPAYSVQAGIRLANYYARVLEGRGYRRDEPVFWPFVKLHHAIGIGDAGKILAWLRDHGVHPSSWEEARQYLLAEGPRIKQERGLKASGGVARFVANVDGVVTRGRALWARWQAAHGAAQEAEWEGEDAAAGASVDRGSPEYVEWVQRSLNQILGLSLAVDGDYGNDTRAAVRRFQEQQGLAVDGAVGPHTEAALIAAGAGPPPVAAPPPAVGLDTNLVLTSNPDYLPGVERATWKGMHLTCVGRYLRNLSAAEVAALSADGFGVFSIYERGWPTTDAYFSCLDNHDPKKPFTCARPCNAYQKGVDDGQRAFAQAFAIGQPSGKPIYFAVDYDVQPASKSLVTDYFQGVRDGMAQAAQSQNTNTTYPIGVYSSYDVLGWTQAQGIVTYFWQSCSTAFSQGRNAHRWPGANLRQIACERPIAVGASGTIHIDFDEVYQDAGAWMVGVPASAPASAPSSTSSVPGLVHDVLSWLGLGEMELEDAPEPPATVVDRHSPEYIAWMLEALNHDLGTHLAPPAGAETRDAIRRFQQKHHLHVDGEVGPNTEAQLTAVMGAGPPQVAPPAAVGIDYDHDVQRSLPCLELATWKGQHLTFVVRYYSGIVHSDGTRKDLDLDEAQALAMRGFRCVAVWERRGGDAYYTRANGEHDGYHAFAIATQNQQPWGTPIYFAVDNVDPQAPAQRHAIEQYFEGVQAGMSRAQSDPKVGVPGAYFTVGVYASYNALDWCKAQGIATYFWQSCSRATSAWRNEHRWPGVHLWQVKCEKKDWCGIDVDVNEAYAADYGGWMPMTAWIDFPSLPAVGGVIAEGELGFHARRRQRLAGTGAPEARP